MKKATKEQKRLRRRVRSRARMSGTATRPRMSVHRSLRGMYVQLIDDAAGKTLASAHSKNTPVQESEGRSGKVAVAYTLGNVVGKAALDMGIKEIVFDRSGYAYHGRVAAVADGARDAGLTF